MTEEARDRFPASKPLKADGGIKARSKRGSIGEQWWSRRFIDVLESFGLTGRLSRGRNYARSGQVLSLEIAAGTVTARVQGSRIKPYQVELAIAPLTARQWRRVAEALAERAIFRARLLAAEMPAEIEQVFADCGTPLFPAAVGDLQLTCSCPDYVVPCKHLAAVCYVLAEAFDDDPFAMLAWRGKGRDDLLATLRRLTGRPEAAGEPDDAGEPEAGGRPVIDVTDEPLAAGAGFWSSSLGPARLRALPPAAPAPADLLLRTFEPPFLTAGGMDLVTLLRPAYLAMTGSEPGGDEPPGAEPARSGS